MVNCPIESRVAGGMPVRTYTPGDQPQMARLLAGRVCWMSCTTAAILSFESELGRKMIQRTWRKPHAAYRATVATRANRATICRNLEKANWFLINEFRPSENTIAAK